MEQPGEDAKKSFMWRLTPSAISDGVKSTTRYRSKQPNKRGHRSGNPQPQRQASGAKGGLAARRSAKMRRSQRVHDTYVRGDPYFYTSVPPNYEQGNLDSPPEMPLQYPPSPYYGSDVDFNTPYTSEQFNNPFAVPGSGLPFHTQPQLMSSPMGADNTYMPAQDPCEPLFWGSGMGDSPSPTATDPPTPENQGMPDVMDMGLTAFNDLPDADYCS